MVERQGRQSVFCRFLRAMRLPISLISSAFFLVGFLIGDAVVCAPSSPLQQAATKVLREMPIKLYEGRTTVNDLQACVKLIALEPVRIEPK